jgi:hypothetical protein
LDFSRRTSIGTEVINQLALDESNATATERDRLGKPAGGDSFMDRLTRAAEPRGDIAN